MSDFESKCPDLVARLSTKKLQEIVQYDNFNQAAHFAFLN